jgi:hypothetical protein
MDLNALVWAVDTLRLLRLSFVRPVLFGDQQRMIHRENVRIRKHNASVRKKKNGVKKTKKERKQLHVGYKRDIK